MMNTYTPRRMARLGKNAALVYLEIASRPSASRSAIAASLGLGASAVSRAITELCERGLAQRNGRSVTLSDASFWPHPGHGGTMGSLVDQMKAIAGEVTRADSRGSASEFQALIAAYTTARRAVDYGYKFREKKAIVTVAKRLKERCIDRSLFTEYIAHAFEAWRNVTRGEKMAWPPVAFLGAYGVIDRFVQELGPREIDVARLRRFLITNGHNVDATVCAMILRLSMEDDVPPPRSIETNMRRAVLAAKGSFTEIGYTRKG